MPVKRTNRLLTVVGRSTRARAAGRACRALAVLSLVGAISGCAAAIPLLASGIGSGAGYSMLNIAHKTQTYPVQTVYRATLQALSCESVNFCQQIRFREQRGPARTRPCEAQSVCHDSAKGRRLELG